MRSNHSTRTKTRGPVKAHKDLAPRGERRESELEKVKTKSGTHPNLIAQALGKPEKDPEAQRDQDLPETNPVLNLIGRAQASGPEKDPELRREREKVETNRGP